MKTKWILSLVADTLMLIVACKSKTATSKADNTVAFAEDSPTKTDII